MNTEKQNQEQSDVLTAEKAQHHIILYNDEVNTFDHVINTLVKACDHSENQAHQCSLIVHYKGKCEVKTGDYKDLKPRCTKLLQAGLSAEIV